MDIADGERVIAFAIQLVEKQIQNENH